MTKDEYNARLAIFKQNYDIVQAQNQKNEGFELELNRFADMSTDEYSKLLGFKDLTPEGDEPYEADNDGDEGAVDSL